MRFPLDKRTTRIVFGFRGYDLAQTGDVLLLCHERNKKLKFLQTVPVTPNRNARKCR
jgi:hypothetical protein